MTVTFASQNTYFALARLCVMTRAIWNFVEPMTLDSYALSTDQNFATNNQMEHTHTFTSVTILATLATTACQGGNSYHDLKSKAVLHLKLQENPLAYLIIKYNAQEVAFRGKKN